MLDTTTDTTARVILIYAGLSLVIGGIAASYEIWHKPTMLDRANGRGKFSSPKESAFGICLFVAILWPILAVLAIADAWSARR
jgi:hypothetical protein